MKKLTLNQWTNIAEIVGMMAVFVSLVFVGLEIRQNTDQAKAEGLETGTDFIKVVYNMADTTESADFILKGLADFNSLTRSEKIVFDGTIVNVTIEFEVVEELYSQGNIAEDRYYNYEEMMARILMCPGVITWYEMTENTFPEEVKERFSLIKQRHADKENLLEYFKYERGGK
ncbi:MAG: hypothetical protein HOJ34_04300 [Kordiimonadaceae bacterium]|nr:hypothetical protein [Kordiimonadaceae bacterium]MBT6328984.1 hypothetical protein [Kordiimonadaceae bacterium]MBT7583623.1 hypothetical protein [Kordiimonadaceae bacterium]